MNKTYKGKIPPCGIDCGKCPNFLRENNRCLGAEESCRKCKTIYVCCVEKKGLEYCYQCKTFPCARFKKFSATWIKLGQNLIDNQNNQRK